MPAIVRIIVVVFALLAAACASSRTLSGSLNDIGADANLKALLLADRRHDYSDVDLTVYEGRLMLTGTMRSEDGRKQLVENAWEAPGIRQVIDEIFVGDRTPFDQGLEDARIDQAIRWRLLTSGKVRSGNYKMSVSGGVVYMLGVAENEAELQTALYIARSTAGVASVISHVIYRENAPIP